MSITLIYDCPYGQIHNGEHSEPHISELNFPALDVGFYKLVVGEVGILS